MVMGSRGAWVTERPWLEDGRRWIGEHRGEVRTKGEWGKGKEK